MTTLRDEGWRASDPRQADDGTWSVTLVLPNEDGGIIHAVTGQGVDAEAALAKATEMANRWRRMQAEWGG